MNIVQNLYESAAKLLNIESNNVDDIISIAFGLSSGIMTLIGLIAIFVSINSQHVVVKCRELLWELINMPYEDREYNEKTFWKVRSNIELYAKLLQGSRITKLVVHIAFIVLVVVSIIWITTIFTIRFSFTSSEFRFVLFWGIICSVINIAFSIVLLFLNKIKVVGEFPTVEELLDGKIDTDVHTLTIAGMTMLEEFSSKGTIFFFPIPFKNIIIKFQDSGEKFMLDGENYDYKLSDRGYGIRCPFILPNNQSKIEGPHFRLISQVGVVSVHYEKGNEVRYFPKHVIEKRMIDQNSYFDKIRKEKEGTKKTSKSRKKAKK